MANIVVDAVHSLSDGCPGQRGSIALGRALNDSTSLGLLDISSTLDTPPKGCCMIVFLCACRCSVPQLVETTIIADARLAELKRLKQQETREKSMYDEDGDPIKVWKSRPPRRVIKVLYDAAGYAVCTRNCIIDLASG